MSTSHPYSRTETVRHTGGMGYEYMAKCLPADNTAYFASLPYSKGHLAWEGGSEWYVRDGEIYRAPERAPVMPDGYRSGRWQCSLRHARQHPTVYDFLVIGISEYDGVSDE